ncbi:hypothetical protein D3C75_749880 [compost metagenome]
MLGLLQQAYPLAHQIELLEVTGQPIVQLVPVVGVIDDEPGQRGAHQLRIDLPLRGQVATQTRRPPTQGQQQLAVGHLLFILLEGILELVDLLGNTCDQQIHAIGQRLGEKQHHFRDRLRPFAALEGVAQGPRRLDRAHAQGNDLAGIGIDPQRHHVFRRSTGVEVDPAQKQQQALPTQRHQSRPGRLLQQQIAGELVQTAGFAQPLLRLRHAAVPVQPEAFLRTQVEHLQLVALDPARTTLAVQHETVDQPALVASLVRLHGLSSRTGSLRHAHCRPKETAPGYSGIFSSSWATMMPLLSA